MYRQAVVAHLKITQHSLGEAEKVMKSISVRISEIPTGSVASNHADRANLALIMEETVTILISSIVFVS
jgi:hypothetical protein